jgi:3-hydroxymyristoyl/3-hydroxydecanoyl-(acyl carrier protein) dehydratase
MSPDISTSDSEAHGMYPEYTREIAELLAREIALQRSLLHSSAAGSEKPADSVPRKLSRELCRKFAVGKIADVLGPKYADIDRMPARVRLPDDPFLFVDRVLDIKCDPLSMNPGSIVTELDVTGEHLDCGRLPVFAAVETIQALLLLSAYAGMDHRTKGLAVPRLVDLLVTFHGDLPPKGGMIRYEGRILRFFEHGGRNLFRSESEITAEGKPLLTVKDAALGFFSNDELAAGKGVIVPAGPESRALPADWVELAKMGIESYCDGQLDALREGNLAGCFGPDFEGLETEAPPTIPGGRLKLIRRVHHIDPKGGRYGLGLIRTEQDISPDDWYFAAHFPNDPVMPGNLMYESCLQALRIFLLRRGFVGGKFWQPVAGITTALRFRGQVTPSSARTACEIHIKEIGYGPEPYAIADGIMFAGGKVIFDATNMSIRLAGSSKEKLLSLWEKNVKQTIGKKAAVFDHNSILAFAEGKPSDAFGEKYKSFDDGRFLARCPRPPFNFIHRVTEARAEQWKMVSGGSAETQYDVSDDWYFSSNRSGSMPYAVLNEIALQSCGWYSAYIGTSLAVEGLRCRNLGGSAAQMAVIPRGAGEVTTKVKSKKISNLKDVIIQDFEFKICCGGRIAYSGETTFGFFTEKALEQQEGIRNAGIYRPAADDGSRGKSTPYPDEPPFPDEKFRMMDRVELYLPEGGPKGLGFIRGSMNVDPAAWFFKAHFYQDPVMPGSLGIESMLQLLKFAAHERWGPGETTAPAPGAKHRWVYRGQVIPKNKKVTVDVWITSADDLNRVMFADGFVSVDGLTIYELRDFSLRMMPPSDPIK